MAHLVALAGVLGASSACALLPLQGATSLAGGESVACAALTGGGAACWGADVATLLGRSTSGRAAGPVGGLAATLASVTVGGQHACAVDSSGNLLCWGENFAGQLGVGSTSSFQGPQVVPLLADVSHAAAGPRHTCAVAAGSSYCWGDNGNGQLGDGTTTQRNAPVAVGLAAGVQRVAAGGQSGGGFTCEVASGSAWCWGQNGTGQLGDGTTEQRLLPVPVVGLSAMVATIAAGRRHACAVQGGAVKCWGANEAGQLGDGTTAQRLAPVWVNGASADMVAVAAGSTHSCALRDDGAVLCWGENSSGQLGDGTLDTRYVAGPVLGLAGPAVGVAVTDTGSCVLLATGDVECFGRQVLGIGALTERFLPGEVVGFASGIATLTGGDAHTCGTSASGAAMCFGSGSYGQLGLGHRGVAVFPTILTALPAGVAEVSAGSWHTCARTQAGAADCWGEGSYGKLGNGSLTDMLVPTPVAGMGSGVADIAAGGVFSCAVDVAGAAKCWGSNSSGSLGSGGGAADSAVPVPVAGLVQGVARIAAGHGHACALRTGGGVKCWGRNSSGQVGDATVLDRFAPVDVLGLAAGIVDIAAGDYHTCGVTASGVVLCWGANSSGQLGDGSTLERRAPVQVVGLPAAAVQVAAGREHTCALMAGGEVYCWGSNGSGQSGPDGGAAVPVVVPLIGPAVSITAGAAHTCAVIGNGRALCWGDSSRSQLGNGDAEFSTVPRFVAVGDFHANVEVTSSPNPSEHGEHVTIVARVTAADTLAAGWVTFTDTGAPLRCSPFSNEGLVSRSEARCTVPLLDGLHELRADYASSSGLLPSFGLAQHSVLAVAGQHCAGFDDVDAASPFCRSVEWVRNRGVTQGCLAFEYCPGAPVSRLAMSAFMDRLGAALTPAIVQNASVPGWLFGGPLQCPVTIPAATPTRRAIVDVVVSATSDVATALDFEPVARSLAVPFPEVAIGPAVRVAVHPTAPFAIRLQGTADVGVEDGIVVGVRFTGPGAASSITDARCIVRVLVFNRDVAHAPFDPSPGGKP